MILLQNEIRQLNQNKECPNRPTPSWTLNIRQRWCCSSLGKLWLMYYRGLGDLYWKRKQTNKVDPYLESYS